MFPDQKFSPRGLAKARLLLVAAVLIFSVAALVAVGYLARNRPIMNQKVQVSFTPESVTMLTPESTLTATPTATPSSAINSESEISDIAVWETYRNDKYGFKFKYPKEFSESISCKINEENNAITIGNRVSISILDSNRLTLNSFAGGEVERILKDKILETDISNYNDIDSENAVRIHYQPVGTMDFGVTIYMLHQNNVYKFQFYSGVECGSSVSELSVLEDIIYTFQFLNKVTFIDKVTFGNLSAYINRDIDYNYIILSEGGKEIIVDKGPMTYNGGVNDEWGPKFLGGLSFSPKGNYLLYGAGMHEAGASYVYDINNKKNVLTASDDSSGIGFTPDEKYFYACSWAGMGSDALGVIYSVPDFKVIYDALKVTEHYGGISCRYDSDVNSIIFYGEKDILRYSLKEQKEYKLYKETGNEESVQSE